MASAVPGEANPVGAPATFLFGFQGVGGVAPSHSALTPILPIDSVPDVNIFEFENPVSGLWYDPPVVDGYAYEPLGDPLELRSQRWLLAIRLTSS